MTSPKASLEEYLRRYSNRALSSDEVVSIMVGDLQRIRLYPARGFQIPQAIPNDIWDALEYEAQEDPFVAVPRYLKELQRLIAVS